MAKPSSFSDTCHAPRDSTTVQVTVSGPRPSFHGVPWGEGEGGADLTGDLTSEWLTNGDLTGQTL